MKIKEQFRRDGKIKTSFLGVGSVGDSMILQEMVCFVLFLVQSEKASSVFKSF